MCDVCRERRGGLSFRLKEGDKIIVTGQINVYVRDGKYQLYADRIEKAGIGELAERYEKLKKELEERGMFDPSYKRKLPPYIRTLGVVTAPTGAAVRDIIQISKRRNPWLQIILYPAIVQGEHAPASIVRGIRSLDLLGVDLIIAGRGGGSLEDLWAFNEEIVAEAFFDCSVPVISAVGHETDTVLSDFVADLRAPTPSAAAELAVCDIREVLKHIADDRSELNRQMDRRIAEMRLRAENYEARMENRSPKNRLREKQNLALFYEEKLAERMKEKLLKARHRLSLADAEKLRERMKGKLIQARHRLSLADEEKLTERIKGKLLKARHRLSLADEEKLTERMKGKLTRAKHRLSVNAERLDGKSPLKRLSGGFIYAKTKEDKGLRSVDQVAKGDELHIYAIDGEISAEVLKTWPKKLKTN